MARSVCPAPPPSTLSLYLSHPVSLPTVFVFLSFLYFLLFSLVDMTQTAGGELSTNSPLHGSLCLSVSLSVCLSVCLSLSLATFFLSFLLLSFKSFHSSDIWRPLKPQHTALTSKQQQIKCTLFVRKCLQTTHSSITLNRPNITQAWSVHSKVVSKILGYRWRKTNSN